MLNKSDSERQLQYDITYVWNIKNKLVSITTTKIGGFFAYPVVKNLPSNAGDMDLISGSGNSDRTCHGEIKPKHRNKRSPHSATKIECSQDLKKKEIKKKKRNRLTDMENKEWRSGKIEVGSSEVQTTMYEINKLQGSIVQNREYSQYFTLTIMEYNLLKL